jgi:SAM-dependent methyltransferase
VHNQRPSCYICFSPMRPPIGELFDLPSVTSDCRAWAPGRSVRICPCCGVMERAVKPFAPFDTIYDNYDMFPHADGGDQINFSGNPQGRTSKILNFIGDMLGNSLGKVLDIGCGNGAGVRALSKKFPTAAVYGCDPNSDLKPMHFPENVTILDEMPSRGQFSLVTMFHVLEHLMDPYDMLEYVDSIMAPHGRLLIQVPYAIMGAFDLVVADHIWHFTMKSLLLLLNNAGFYAVYIGNDVITKEITVVAARGEPLHQRRIHFKEAAHCQDSIDELLDYKEFLDGLEQKVAVYGTGPAAAWVHAVIGDKIEYFMDDDSARVGKRFQGKPILSTNGNNLPVIAPFPEHQLQEVMKRNPGLGFIAPLELKICLTGTNSL